MCPHQNPVEDRRLPKEYAAPQEYIIPEEYPVSQPAAPVTKKKSGLRYLVLFGFSAFVALHLCFGFLFADIGKKKPQIVLPGGETPGGTLPNISNVLDLSFFEEGLSDASEHFIQTDYVGAAVAVCDCLSENFAQGGGYQLHNANLVYEDGVLSPFEGRDVTDGSGVYLRFALEIVQVYNEKVEDYDPEERLLITLIHVSKEGRNSRTIRVLNLQIATFYLSYSDSVYSDSSYLEGTFTSDYSAETAEMIDFGVQTAYNDPDVGNYNVFAERRVRGPVESGHFSGEVSFKNTGLLLNEEKTAFVPSGENAAYENLYDLDKEGKLSLSKLDYADLSGHESGSDAYRTAWKQAIADAQVRYILGPETDGYQYLYVKNLIYEEDKTHKTQRHEVGSLDAELFPMTDTLPKWLELEPHIQ